MATQKQIAANRLNARKSTGPRSAEGKSRASMNALKSGIDAKSQIIRGESANSLQALQTEYYDRFRPTTPEQRTLVDTLIDSEWLLRRFRTVESQIWEEAAPAPGSTTGPLAYAFRRAKDDFTRLQRRIDGAQRHYRNALRELARLQAEETTPDPAPEPVTASIETAKPQNGFVPPNPSDPAAPLQTESSRPILLP